MQVYDAALVEARLLAAGRALMALAVAGTFPGGYRSGMPEPIRKEIEGYGWEESMARPAAPTIRQLREMEQAFGWVPLIPAENIVYRRIVWARLLCRPNQERPMLSWRQVAERVGASHEAVRGWHAIAISIIVGRLNAPGLCAAAGGGVGPGRGETELAIKRGAARAHRDRRLLVPT